jgi:hypothetical protein
MKSSWHQGISGSMFGLVVVCFQLPFVTLSCANEQTRRELAFQGDGKATLSGIELVTGSQTRPEFGDSTTEPRLPSDPDFRVPPEPFAVLALVLAIVGVGTVFLRRERSRNSEACAVAVAGAVSLLLLALSPTLRVLGFVEIKVEIGYWLAMLGFAAAAGWHAALVARSSPPAPETASALSPP